MEVGVVDLRHVGEPFGDAIVQLGGVRLGEIERLIRRDALTRNLVAVEFAFGEDRQEIVEFLDLLGLDALDHAALGGEFGLPAFEIGDVDRVGLRDETVDGGGGVEVLHRHLEAEVLGGLVADRLHDGIRDTDVAQLDILDLLRPDRRESRDHAGPGDRAGRRRARLQK